MKAITLITVIFIMGCAAQAVGEFTQRDRQMIALGMADASSSIGYSMDQLGFMTSEQIRAFTYYSMRQNNLIDINDDELGEAGERLAEMQAEKRRQLGIEKTSDVPDIKGDI